MEKLFLGKVLEKIPRIFRHIYTLFVVTFGWVIFRCDDGLGHLASYVKAMFSFHISERSKEILPGYLAKYGIYLILGVFFSIPIYRLLKGLLAERLSGRPGVKAVAAGLGYAVLLAMLYVSVLYLVNSTYNPFIYFRF